MISIIIPNWNGKHFLDTCLSSLLRMNCNVSYEIIIVDNGSEDGSIEFLEINYPDVRVIALNENTGFAYAVQCGIDNAKYEFVALLNNDIEVDKNWLEALYNIIIKDKNIGVCASKMLYFHNRDIINSAGIYYAWDGGARDIGIDEKDIGQYNKLESIFGACAGAALYRKSALEEIGGFDIKFFAYYEDVDVSFRMQLYAYKVYYVPDAIVYHIGSGSTGKVSDFVVLNGHRNLIWLLIKNMPDLLLLLYSPFIILYQFYALWNSYRRGQLKISLKARKNAMSNLSFYLKERKKIQKNRRVSLSYLHKLFLNPLSLMKSKK